jgi:ring-1,2-phenylacetyl-CoA epoxidase subunit PaaC
LTNISLDLFGQAETLYEYAVLLKEANITADDLAFLRNERQFYNSLIVEQPNGDFAFTIVRQFLYSTFARLMCEALMNSNDESLSGYATKALKEVKYHFRHSSEWIIRFGNGTEESKNRAQFALNELWRFTDDLFVMNDIDHELISVGISFSLDDIFGQWNFAVQEVLREANLFTPERFNVIKGGSNGIHTEHLGHMLSEMQYLQRVHPGAKW